MDKKPSIAELPTIGFPNYYKCYKLTDGSLVHVTINDTVGQEKFKSLADQYYREADCCLLVYDISDKKTFDECKNFYVPKMKELCKPNIKVILLGNKTDLVEKREVRPEEGALFAMEKGFKFLETSCLKNENVASAFETLIEMTNIEVQKNKQQKNTKLNKKEHKKDEIKEEKRSCPC